MVSRFADISFPIIVDLLWTLAAERITLYNNTALALKKVMIRRLAMVCIFITNGGELGRSGRRSKENPDANMRNGLQKNH
jgi:hypothetical protein